MRTVVRQIDRALKDIYRIPTPQNAESFLVRHPVGDQPFDGALLVQPGADLSLGIYLSEHVRRNLADFRRSRQAELVEGWTVPQLNAFLVAVEEVSHFHCLLHHVHHGATVTQLEMEIQGEIDKFLLAFFAGALGAHPTDAAFYALFEQLFQKFHWAEGVGAAERARYEEANQLAKAFILKWAIGIWDPARRERHFALLRRFYRLPFFQKVALFQP